MGVGNELVVVGMGIVDGEWMRFFYGWGLGWNGGILVGFYFSIYEKEFSGVLVC